LRDLTEGKRFDKKLLYDLPVFLLYQGGKQRTGYETYEENVLVPALIAAAYPYDYMND